MIFLRDYKDAIGKSIKEVRKSAEDHFDDPIEVTLILFTDETALLIRREICDSCYSGIIDLTDHCFTINVEKELGL